MIMVKGILLWEQMTPLSRTWQRKETTDSHPQYPNMLSNIQNLSQELSGPSYPSKGPHFTATSMTIMVEL